MKRFTPRRVEAHAISDRNPEQMPFTRIPVFPRKSAIVLAVTLALTMAGCAVGPDYKRPDTAVPASYKEAPEGWKVAPAFRPRWTVEIGGRFITTRN